MGFGIEEAKLTSFEKKEWNPVLSKFSKVGISYISCYGRKIITLKYEWNWKSNVFQKRICCFFNCCKNINEVLERR